MIGYVVVDLETTGFSPTRQDRVVEIGVVAVDLRGGIEDRWCTLVNPERDMGATHVHGITAADVLSAPTFRQIAPRLLEATAGRTLVAHNARFDLSFLQAELARAGYNLEPGTPHVCTMEWSTRFLHGTSRKLSDCCRLAGIANDCDHTADADAMATAALLAYYIKAGGEPPPWQTAISPFASYQWPALTDALIEVELVHRRAKPEAPDGWLDRITSKMGRVADPMVESYVDVLERALLDGHLSAHEKRDLIALAESLGLQRSQLDKVHQLYLSAMACAAWADGVVTLQEQFQLSQVAASLSIANDTAKRILLEAQGREARFDVPTLHLAAGDRVVFTGELAFPRDKWIARVGALGIDHGSVTRTTRAVVAADPDSLSGKASKARDYGVPIITEAAFETLISQMEERHAARSRALSE